MRKFYLTFVQKLVVLSMLCLPFYGMAQQSSIQTLPSFKYNDKVPVSKGQFLPAVPAWQPRNTTAITTVMSQNFKAGRADWKTQGPDWQITNGKAEAAGLSSGKTSYLMSAALKIDKGTFKLRYKEKFELESYHDFGVVWITTDAGAHWRTVHTVTGVADWRDSYIDLRAYQGKTVQFAFMIQTDESVNGAGWQINNLEVVRVEDRAVATNRGKSALALAQQLQDSLNAILTGRETNTFPTISATVRVEDMPNLVKNNFEITENSEDQDFNVILPQGDVTRPADIVFIVDNSGSMSPYQLVIQNSVTDFVNDLFDAGVNAALGLTRFGQSYSGEPIVEENGTLFTDPDVYLNTIFSRNTDDGFLEPGLDAILASVSGFNFRPNSQKIFIILTNEEHNGTATEVSTVEPVLEQNAVTLFSIIDSGYSTSQEDYGDLAVDTGGQQFEIDDLFDPTTLQPIIDAIEGNIATADTYIFSYKSSHPTLDGVERKVNILISTGAALDTVSFTYTPGAAPSISLNQSTLDLIGEPQPPGSAFNIQATISDLNEPFVQSATLLYKNTSDVGYSSVMMSNTSGDLWEAAIPTSVANMPGVDFYITATDGISTTSNRANSPAENPYQITINPNVAPLIVTDSITSLNFGQDLVITAEITDNTDEISSASLFYRNLGEPLYREVLLNNTGGATYMATVDASLLSTNGVQYYIRATDNYGISSYFGEPDDPIFIEILQGTTVGTLTLIDSETDMDLLEIHDGDEYAIKDLPGLLAIRADFGAAIGSVVFDLSGPFKHKMTETNAPYAIFGNVGNDYAGRIFPPGNYVLTATPYSGAKGTGTAGDALQVNFSIVIDDIPDDISVIGFDLYDAFSDSKIMDLIDGSVIDLDNLERNSFNVLTITLPDFIGSLKVELDGPVSAVRIENNKPYTIFGNNSINFYGRALLTGNYTLKATPYTGMGGMGTAGTALEIGFQVVGSTTAEALAVYPTPFSDHFMVQQRASTGTLSVKLYDQRGQPIAVETLPQQNGIRVVAPRALQEGIYILQSFLDGQLLKTEKIQKLR